MYLCNIKCTCTVHVHIRDVLMQYKVYMYSTCTYKGCTYVIQSVHVAVHVHIRDVLM